VGPRIKFPSTLAGGMAPSGSSVAATNPGECGSRVGGVGRAGRADVCGAGELDGEGDWAGAEVAHASKIIQEATARQCRNVDSLCLEQLCFFTSLCSAGT
jgi:hypothetical protein